MYMNAKEDTKIYKEIIFQDRDGKQIDLNKVNTDKIYILNFWATWCAPCREEMPSLDKLQEKNGIFIFPINLEEKNLQKTEKFYKDLNISVLKIFDVKNSMNSKNSFGGTSEKNVKNMIKKYKKELK